MNSIEPNASRTMVIKPSLFRSLFSRAFLPSLFFISLLFLAIDLWMRNVTFIQPLYIITLILLWTLSLFAWLQSISFACYVTHQQLWVEQGFIWKTTKFYELYRIRDYAENRSILDRMLGTMQLKVFTMDAKPFDLLELRNIPHSSIAMLIRERVQQSKKANNMFFIENDTMR